MLAKDFARLQTTLVERDLEAQINAAKTAAGSALTVPGGGTAGYVLTKTSATTGDYSWQPAEDMAAYATQVDDVDPTTVYFGQAAPGSAKSAAAWRVMRITISGSDVATEWADGSSAFTQVWDDRATLTYS